VLNKLDLVEKIPQKDRVSPIARFEKHFPELKNIFAEIFGVSALNGHKILELQVNFLNFLHFFHFSVVLLC